MNHEVLSVHKKLCWDVLDLENLELYGTGIHGYFRVLGILWCIFWLGCEVQGGAVKMESGYFLFTIASSSHHKCFYCDKHDVPHYNLTHAHTLCTRLSFPSPPPESLVSRLGVSSIVSAVAQTILRIKLLYLHLVLTSGLGSKSGWASGLPLHNKHCKFAHLPPDSI